MRDLKSFPIIVAGLALAAGTSAQTTPAQTAGQAAELRIQGVFDKLRMNDGLHFSITGTERVDKVSTPINSDLYYQTSTDSTGRVVIKSNLIDSISPNGVPVYTSETIADGKLVWAYDRIQHTYSVVPYDVQNSQDPSLQSPTYARDLLYSMNQSASASGRSSYATRLLRELYADPSGAKYRSWMPGRTPYETSTYHDPFNNLDITAPNSVYEVYDTDPRRAIAFEIYTDPNTNEDSLSRIYFTERAQFGTKVKVTSWSLAPTATNDFSAARFAPYNRDEIRGWRPLVAPRPVRG
ncbi:hypothetical protein OP10G_3644 [Fimbriimonas ginsengisoli Gsoil 348]|uniref:Outer membrane lipoprotein-sorting protein n=1 Tax=Fimbriimonas ginsengisoli Gsoil 348 TaxID=661478 RepID=A0A068NUI3_FIMGI|nr:hypothetical protein OP10G_3644 [Fimbriimonas ginsengisoli Gsoil 348]